MCVFWQKNFQMWPGDQLIHRRPVFAPTSERWKLSPRIRSITIDHQNATNLVFFNSLIPNVNNETGKLYCQTTSNSDNNSHVCDFKSFEPSLYSYTKSNRILRLARHSLCKANSNRAQRQYSREKTKPKKKKLICATVCNLFFALFLSLFVKGLYLSSVCLSFGVGSSQPRRDLF